MIITAFSPTHAILPSVSFSFCSRFPPCYTGADPPCDTVLGGMILAHIPPMSCSHFFRFQLLAFSVWALAFFHFLGFFGPAQMLPLFIRLLSPIFSLIFSCRVCGETFWILVQTQSASRQYFWLMSMEHKHNETVRMYCLRFHFFCLCHLCLKEFT
jgi:hypothetical protein